MVEGTGTQHLVPGHCGSWGVCVSVLSELSVSALRTGMSIWTHTHTLLTSLSDLSEKNR
jgi:hypothetical protein